jgi:hypothetical protein
MNIYWTAKSIPELCELPRREGVLGGPLVGKHVAIGRFGWRLFL